MDELEKQTALKADPMLIDVRIDQALFQYIQERLKDSPSQAAIQYYRAKADFVNVLTFLRLRNISKPGLHFDAFLGAGRGADPGTWRRVADEPERLPFVCGLWPSCPGSLGQGHCGQKSAACA